MKENLQCSRRQCSPHATCRPKNPPDAFTLLELLVTVGILAIMIALAVPAWARQKLPSRTTSCLANYRQWAVVANLYAADYHDSLPAIGSVGFGGYPSDAGLTLASTLGRYGATVPIFYCPMRPWEFESDTKQHHGPIITMDDLNSVMTNPALHGGETSLHQNYWVVRGSPPYPADVQTLPQAEAYGGFWPLHRTDQRIATVPFISDECFSPVSDVRSTNLDAISPATAHFTGGKVVSVNCGYGDGHAVTHSRTQIKPVYTGANLSTWFY
jgi:prepilin-type N-terminal cleavage/methylation domain-containing protein